MKFQPSSRTLRIAGATVPLWQGLPVLTPVRLEGTEAINELFVYRLILKSPDVRDFGPSGAANIPLSDFVGRELTVLIELEDVSPLSLVSRGTREITGLVSSARFINEAGRHAYYEFILKPWLHLASLTSDCKIFQNQTVVEILDALLADYAFPVDKRLGVAYPMRDTQTQLNETDLEFFQRLCQEWGINFHFEHSDGKHRLVLCDNNGAFLANTSPAFRTVRFHNGKNKIDEEYINDFTLSETLTSGSYESRDYDYTRPRAQLAGKASDPGQTGQPNQDLFSWRADTGNDYSQPNAGAAQEPAPIGSQGDALARLRLEAVRQHATRGSGQGELRGLLPGHTFTLTGHPQDKANNEYVLLSTTLLIEDVAETSQASSSGPASMQSLASAAVAKPQEWQVHVRFGVQPARVEVRPELTRGKPRQHSPETALVVGPEDAQGVANNIHTDDLGRIKVQFYWDRYGQKNHNSSCWVRVSSASAGNQLGNMQLPRVGQEVIVSFLGGDPDLPLVTGRVFNQLNTPPWKLPSQQALSGFRSRELAPNGGNSAAGRSNHLILDDTLGGIQAQLKSDHQHSQLSLGHITRIEDNAGRKEARGQGFELRTDGHGVLRAQDGLLLTTEGRLKARAHIKDMAETVQRLTAARDQHENLAAMAQHHNAQDADADQAAVSAQLKTQNEALKGGAGADGGPGKFPEMSAPHLVLASAAGITATAADDLHLAARLHVATTSGGHTSLSSGKSLLASAMDAIRLFAHKAGIRIFAAQGPVQLQAQDDQIELIAKKAIALISTTDWITLNATVGIKLQAAGSTLLVDAQGFRFYTVGAHHVWAADHQTFGPKSLEAIAPRLPTSVCIPCLLRAAKAASALTRF